jgi:hypothetical protein
MTSVVGRPSIGTVLRLALVLVLSAASLEAQLPGSALSVHRAGGKAVWWRAAEAPVEWTAAIPIVTEALRWTALRPGLESARLDLSGDHAGWRVEVILARIDPAAFSLRLDSAVIDAKPAWNIRSLPSASALAVNAGQFEGDQPWGWLVRDGREIQAPRPGPLSSALIVDRQGRAAIIDAGEIAAARKRGDLLQAFQSYPAILVADGTVPNALRAPGRGVDVEHRDSRVALGILQDGRLMIALTRFAGMGSPLSRLPFGPTTPEMAAIMGALGCRRAMLLDGGLSGQLLLRDARGRTSRWPGLRAVPLGLIAFPKLETREGR